LKAAVDNDILFKGACYGLLIDLVAAIPCETREVGVLGAAPFVLRSLLRRAKLNGDPSVIKAHLDKLLQQAESLEPTTNETRLAAELEFAAQTANLNLDTGESQLCAIAVHRASWLVTGDKRAVVALELLLQPMAVAAALAGKVICLEQLFVRLLAAIDAVTVRMAVCKEAGIDRALASCFSCYSEEVDPQSWSEGLVSYIADLRSAARTILAA
jgi:hypothetical protein